MDHIYQKVRLRAGKRVIIHPGCGGAGLGP